MLPNCGRLRPYEQFQLAWYSRRASLAAIYSATGQSHYDAWKLLLIQRRTSSVDISQHRLQLFKFTS